MIIMNSIKKFKNDYHEQYKKGLKMIIINNIKQFKNDYHEQYYSV